MRQGKMRSAVARKLLFITLIGILLSSACVFGPGSQTAPVQALDFPNDGVVKQNILEATVLITLFAPVLDESGNPKIFEVNGGEKQRQLTVGDGLGTLVRVGNKTVIITHDHWSLLTRNLYKAQFHSTSNKLLLELDGAMFTSLIRYRNGGIIVLVAPDLLSAQMSAVELVGEDVALQEDDALMIAYWQPESNKPVSVEPVIVETIELYQDLPSIKMKSLSGKVVIYGNSGGGVFFHGRLVGTIWTSLQWQLVVGEDIGVATPTSLSRAALLTSDWSSLHEKSSSQRQSAVNGEHLIDSTDTGYEATQVLIQPCPGC